MAGVSQYALGGFQKQRLLDWLCTAPGDRQPPTLDRLADELQVTRRTLTNWKTTDVEFMEAWEKRYLQTIGNPGVKQDIMATLLRTATDSDDPKHVQAAKAYFEIEGSMKPAKMQVEVRRDTSKLSDEELDELIAQKAATEKTLRTA